ncbi:GNAT family N-acetyltransferase [Staphylococcus chromogenes]|uniref:GNAT family N-acetyltransferase n=1 Tax=Staphylococcus chromogenes TaxID=46126 RepID=UPI000D027A7C|nr:GNAT family N-acetyltransferase [Staphylococcus chromogenes]MEB7824741.1 GNAT family N-acetyltransferase [Staphylococcus chromogenes]
MIHLQFKTDLTNDEAIALAHVYHSVGWRRHTPENIALIYHRSTHIVLAYDDHQIIGCGRALSDGVFNAAIYDIVVRPSYQNQGIGQRLVHQLVEAFGPLSCIHLISTLGNESFYKHCGFKKLTTGMAIYQNPELASQYLE